MCGKTTYGVRRQNAHEPRHTKDMTINDLTVNISHLDRETLLSEWHRLIGTSKLPILATLAGDMSVQDAADGSVHFLIRRQTSCEPN